MAQTKDFQEGYKKGREFEIDNILRKIWNLKLTRETLSEIGYYSESSMEAINWYLEAYTTLLTNLKKQFKQDFPEGE